MLSKDTGNVEKEKFVFKYCPKIVDICPVPDYNKGIMR